MKGNSRATRKPSSADAVTPSHTSREHTPRCGPGERRRGRAPRRTRRHDIGVIEAMMVEMPVAEAWQMRGPNDILSTPPLKISNKNCMARQQVSGAEEWTAQVPDNCMTTP